MVDRGHSYTYAIVEPTLPFSPDDAVRRSPIPTLILLPFTYVDDL